MKKNLLLLVGILGVPLFSWAFAAAECQEIRFSNGDKFCFDLQKVGSERFQSRITSSSLSSNSDLSCRLTLPNGSQVSLPRCEGDFSYAGNAGKIELRADISNYWYELITNYDFRNGSFSTSSSTSSTSRWISEFYSVSDSTPDRDEWVDITLRVKNSSYRSSDYDGRVNFRVEEYRNGRWQSASNYDYDLDKTSYYFSSSDRGEVRFNDLVRFRTEGKFRLYVEADGGSEYTTFTVGREGAYSFSEYTPEWRSVSTSRPDKNEWVDMTLTVKNNSSNYYDGRVNFRVEEYRNGRWQSASNYDYDLDKTSYYFSSSDRGEVRFNDLVRFRTEGEFRVIAEISSHRQNAYQTFYVNSRSSSTSSNNWNSYSNFTDKELSKIRAVAKIWNELMIALEKDYPRLRNSIEWRRLSNNFYDSMQDILNNRSSAQYRNWKEFYTGFQEWLSFTVRTR